MKKVSTAKVTITGEGAESPLPAQIQEALALATVSAHMDVDALGALGDRCAPEMADDLQRYLDSLSQRQRAELGGVRDRLAVLGESRLGRIVRQREVATGDQPA